MVITAPFFEPSAITSSATMAAVYACGFVGAAVLFFGPAFAVHRFFRSTAPFNEALPQILMTRGAPKRAAYLRAILFSDAGFLAVLGAAFHAVALPAAAFGVCVGVGFASWITGR